MKYTETETEYILSGEAQCEDCKGTGIYVGIAERGGAGVICWRCKGTGSIKVRVTFKKFNGRGIREGIKRVFHPSSYVLKADDSDTTDKNGKPVTFHYSRYGATYEEWLKGKDPTPMEELECPYEHTKQGLQSKDVNGLYKTRCSNADLLGRYISHCKFHNHKAKCWKIYKGEETK